MVPLKYRGALAGDLEEEYFALLAKFGPGYARRWYWMEVVHTLFDVLISRAKKLGLIVTLAKAAEWLRGSVS